VSIDAAPAVLTRSFFERDAPEVGRDLIGKILCRGDVDVAARIVEVEAYTHDDPASHAYIGPTARNAPMWGPAGHAYVYRSYGMHWCFNVSTGGAGVGQGCLIRAAQPLRGHDWMRARRPVERDVDLLRGPAKLCQALGIAGAMSGSDLCAGGVVQFRDDGTRPEVVCGPRVGVSRAADWPRRYYVAGSRWVSAYRRSPRAPRP